MIPLNEANKTLWHKVFTKSQGFIVSAFRFTQGAQRKRKVQGMLLTETLKP